MTIEVKKNNKNKPGNNPFFSCSPEHVPTAYHYYLIAAMSSDGDFCLRKNNFKILTKTLRNLTQNVLVSYLKSANNSL